ncbi:ACT domain-containing protein [uncultured Microbulbifer sp.]|uniref:ACT domain-containing protein n=1 Tax=uncultured Microbulbifer sp. TaxID=348147 RepID=UPI002620F1AF|nr:ACT domain-containing protein [uncultured Microbulbifer sp.]
MKGEKDIKKLLVSMSPQLAEDEFVFCSFRRSQYGDHTDLAPVAAIKESEGLTLVIPKYKADEKGLSYASSFKKITLNVHSSLDAIGLTAAFSRKLTEHGISANVVAGYYHDHIFVQSALAKKAMRALSEFVQ